MITEDRAYAMFEAANPAPELDRTDQLEAASYLATLEQRSSDMTQVETIPETRPPGRGRGPLIAAAMAAVLLITTIGIILANQDEPDVVDQPDPLPTTPTTVVETQSFDASGALATADSLLVAYSSGEFGSFMAEFTPEATYRDSFGALPLPVEEAAPMLAWYITQGSQILNPQCSVTDEAETGFVVECTSDNTITATEQAANAAGVPTTIRMTVVPEGVETVSFFYREPDFLWVGDLFNRWLDDLHPDVQGAYYGNWSNVDEAREHAQIRAQYAMDWAAWNVTAVEAAFADYNAGDLEEFLGRFGPFASIFDATPSDAPGVFAALMAAGDSYTVHACATDGITVARRLMVTCDVTTGDATGGLSGIEMRGDITFHLDTQGVIFTTETTIDWTPSFTFGEEFKTWLATAHPEIHDQTTWIIDTLPSAADRPSVDPYYAEFIAQSDKYPIGN